MPYRESTQYDALGRAYKVQDATGRWAKTEYNARGYALRVCDSSAADSSPACSGAAFHLQVEAMDARGHVTRERRGGSEGPLTTRTYDPHFGRLETVCSGSACSLQNDRYEFDAKGNLVRRQRDLASPAGTREHFYIEHFRYDAADRLVLGWNEQYQSTVYGEEPPAVNVHRAPPANLSFYAEYDALGNLCRKTSWSTVNSWVAYHYQGASGCGLDGRGGSGSNNTGSGHKLSALEVDAGRSRLWVELDANGNHISGGNGSEAGTKTYRYTGKNQIASIHLGSASAPRLRVQFAYGPDGQRFRRIDDGGGQALRRTTYVGGVERIEEDGAVSWRRPVAGVVLQEIEGEAVSGGITVAGSRTSSHQLYFDHLGSVVLWVDLGAGGGGPPGTGSLFADSFEDGPLPKAALGVSVVQRFDYGPHGEPRPLGVARLAAGAVKTEVPWRGFTGHEHIDALNTIHMTRIAGAIPNDRRSAPKGRGPWMARVRADLRPAARPLPATRPDRAVAVGGAELEPVRVRAEQPAELYRSERADYAEGCMAYGGGDRGGGVCAAVFRHLHEDVGLLVDGGGGLQFGSGHRRQPEGRGVWCVLGRRVLWGGECELAAGGARRRCAGDVLDGGSPGGEDGGARSGGGRHGEPAGRQVWPRLCECGHHAAIGWRHRPHRRGQPGHQRCARDRGGPGRRNHLGD
ncbi:MAG: hypothetical protein KatS3mg126_0005 [Lysobacteraceae bacterium]|nr:MAG: hypothetical protein KatS3mg126_0005 [Xanthomonadaceae bacterium]